MKSLGQGEDGRYELKPREEWVWSEVEAIVSAELWEECNALLAERKRGKKPTKKVRHLFAGLVLCDDCGHKMYVSSNSPKCICGKCRRKLPTEDLEMILRNSSGASSSLRTPSPPISRPPTKSSPARRSSSPPSGGRGLVQGFSSDPPPTLRITMWVRDGI